MKMLIFGLLLAVIVLNGCQSDNKSLNECSKRLGNVSFITTSLEEPNFFRSSTNRYSILTCTYADKNEKYQREVYWIK